MWVPPRARPTRGVSLPSGPDTLYAVSTRQLRRYLHFPVADAFLVRLFRPRARYLLAAGQTKLWTWPLISSTSLGSSANGLIGAQCSGLTFLRLLFF